MTVTDVTGVVRVTAGGTVGTVGTAGTVGTLGTPGTEPTTPPTVSVSEVETAEMADASPRGWAGSGRPIWEALSLGGWLVSAPWPDRARDRKAEAPSDFGVTDAGPRSMLGAKSRA